MLDKVIIYEAENVVGLNDNPKGFAKYCYDNHLKIIRLLYANVSKLFLEDIQKLSKDDLVECLLAELDSDIKTLTFN